MNCRECKHYIDRNCILGNTVMRDGAIGAVEYNLFGKKLIKGRYEDCNDFTSKDELTLFDFLGEQHG